MNSNSPRGLSTSCHRTKCKPLRKKFGFQFAVKDAHVVLASPCASSSTRNENPVFRVRVSLALRVPTREFDAFHMDRENGSRNWAELGKPQKPLKNQLCGPPPPAPSLPLPESIAQKNPFFFQKKNSLSQSRPQGGDFGWVGWGFRWLSLVASG